MHPMQLHWIPRLLGPHATVFGQVVHFCQVILALENSVEAVNKSHY